MQQQAAQCHAAALATAEVLHQLVLVGAAQGVHSALQAAVEVPGVVLLKQFGQLALPFAQLVEVGVGLGEGVVDLFVFLQPVDHVLHGFLHHLLDGLGVVQLGLLLEVADAVAGREDHLALIVLVHAGDDFQQA